MTGKKKKTKQKRMNENSMCYTITYDFGTLPHFVSKSWFTPTGIREIPQIKVMLDDVQSNLIPCMSRKSSKTSLSSGKSYPPVHHLITY